MDEKWRKGVRVAFRAQLSMASDLYYVMWAASDCSGLLGAILVTKDPRQTLHSTTNRVLLSLQRVAGHLRATTLVSWFAVAANVTKPLPHKNIETLSA
jgi:hypothetical protein